MKMFLALGAFAALLTSAAHGQIYNPAGVGGVGGDGVAVIVEHF